MRSVRIKTDELLSVLKQNREKHIAEYELARDEHVADVIKVMSANLKQAKRGGEIVYYINLPVPQSYQDSYDTAIKMLEMSSDHVVELSQNEFQQYVEDKWVWKDAFVAATKQYVSGKL